MKLSLDYSEQKRRDPQRASHSEEEIVLERPGIYIQEFHICRCGSKAEGTGWEGPRVWVCGVGVGKASDALVGSVESDRSTPLLHLN